MPTPPALTEEQQKEARALYAQGLGSVEIAERYGVTHKTILRVIPESEHRTAGTRKQPLPVAEMVSRYEQGETIGSLAREYRVSLDTIKDRLKGTGATRPADRMNTPEGIRTLTQEYENGATLAELSTRYGPSANKVRKLLVANGVTIRPNGVPKGWKKKP